MMARYLLCPGPVISKSDGQEHHVGASQLAALYGVSMRECFVLPTGHDGGSRQTRADLLRRADSGELIALCPLSSGNYHRPERKRK